mgnify:CR=1 FL=1
MTKLHYAIDVTTEDEALRLAEIAVGRGVHILEAGSLLVKAIGIEVVTAIKRAHPNSTVVADLKTMDGGYLEAELMAKAGATHIVVMARAHEETLKCVVKAGTSCLANSALMCCSVRGRSASLVRLKRMA